MADSLPKTPTELRWVVACKLLRAVLAIGLVAGGATYRWETYRVEQAALQRAVEGARHFASPAVELLNDNLLAGSHGELTRLVERNQFVGIRIFGTDQRALYETWADVPAALMDVARRQRHDWPRPREDHRHWTDVAGQRIIQVVLPLTDRGGQLSGYLEAVTRLDEAAVQSQRDQIRNSVLTAVLAVLVTAVVLYPLLLAMLRQSTQLTRRLLDANLSLMRSLGNAVAKRDSDTDIHNYRVTYYAVALAEAMKLPHADILELVSGAFLHDVGKIGVPDHILLKPGKLTAEEYEIMKSHVHLGVEIVGDNPWLAGSVKIIRCHHERFDGTGYPRGLAGESIPLIARIFAVADVFDALTSARPYKKPLPVAEALCIMNESSPQHFDPQIMAHFNSIITGLHAWIAQAGEDDHQQQLHDTLSRYFRIEATR